MLYPDIQSCFDQFKREAMLVNAFKQPRSEFAMDFNCAANNEMR